MKKNAKTVRTSSSEIDKEISERVNSESEEERLMDSISADITPEQMAILSIDQSLYEAQETLNKIILQTHHFKVFIHQLRTDLAILMERKNDQ